MKWISIIHWKTKWRVQQNLGTQNVVATGAARRVNAEE
jgi:hypothetical protein